MSHGPTALLLLANTASTLFLVGLIWFVQVVHYPLFALAGRDRFAEYHAAHTRATTRLVVVPILVEALTALALVCLPTSPRMAAVCWTALGLVVVVWLSTVVLQVPCHRTLGMRFDFQAHQILVRGNWIRSAAWSIRGGLMLCALWQWSAGEQADASRPGPIPLGSIRAKTI